MPTMLRAIVFTTSILFTAVTASAQALPSPWVDDDIGNVGVAGSATYSQGTFTVNGSGTDIWRTADSFHFAYVELPYDGYLEARVTAVSGDEAWAKAGVMIRRSLDANAPHFSFFATPGNGVVHQFRKTAGGTSVSWDLAHLGLTEAPFWVRIRRLSRFVTLQVSKDRVNWTGVPGDDWGLGPVYVGLAVSAHDYWGSATGTFDNVDLVVGPPNQPSQVEITQPVGTPTYNAPATVPVSITASDPDYGIEEVTLLLQYPGGWSTYATWSTSQGYTSPYRYTFRNLEPGTYTIMARVRDRQWGVTESEPVTFRVTDGTLSGVWSDTDIGETGAPGSFSDGDPITVSGAGADIWGQADAFHFAWQQVSGDWEIVARVATIEVLHRWTKAGVMFRENLGAGSKHVSLFASGSGLAFQRRLNEGGLSVHTGAAAYSPIWLRIVRRGSTFAAFWRRQHDQGWSTIGTETVDMPDTIYAGLAVTSHVYGRVARATFDNVSSSAQPEWTGRDIGAVAAAGNDTDQVVSHTVSGSGADIWNAADEFRFASRAWTGDGTIVARVASVENTNAWAKAGLMFRESLGANSKFVAIVVTPGRGIAVQYRDATGALARSVTLAGWTAPVWLRLTRTGNTFTAAISLDNQTWYSGGSVSVTMSSGAEVGLAVTSHADGLLTQAVFQSVAIEK